ncbi:hypothetical protein TNCV_5001151 [Trichonephila clavipes]|nr:hypothetical protein TNCV_5001151 [Trichonephila clavipes]
MFKAVKQYHECKFLSGIDVSEKAGKVSKTMNALDDYRLPAPLKTLNSFLRWYVSHHLQGRRFQSADEVESTSQAKLKNMVKNGFQKCFDELYKLWQNCAVAQVSYFEGECVSTS